jgi:hypothetical protein
MCPRFLYFLTVFGEIRHMRSPLSFVGWAKIGAVQAIFIQGRKWKFFPYFLQFCPIWIKFGMGYFKNFE